jgi:predicted phosphodiesterase
MRVAIFSDVHGNLTALEAVLANMDEQAPDVVVFAGDLCVFGARPAECLELVRELEIASIYGNTDEFIAGPPLLSDDIDEEERRRRQHIHDISSWTHAELNEMQRAWLRELPFHRRISPTPNPRDDLFIVHANPKDVNQIIYPPTSRQEELFGEVKQRDDDLRPLLEDLMIDVLAFGHLHVPNVRRWGDITLANISSVSLPGDGDDRAKYGLLTWADGAGWSVEHRYVEYDVGKELDALAARQPPDWENLIKRLEAGRS